MANDQHVPAAPAWRVTGQNETTVIAPNGQPVDVVQVTFTLANGTVASVNVPQGAFTPDNVRAAIEAKAAMLNAVADLTG
jgi:hypothetical protein